MSSIDPRLYRLRIELFTAAQSLTGEEREYFWKLIDEVQSIRLLHQPEQRADA